MRVEPSLLKGMSAFMEDPRESPHPRHHVRTQGEDECP